MDADGPAPGEGALAEALREGHGPLLRSRDVEVLQIHGRGAAGLAHAIQEAAEVPLPERRRGQGGAAVLGEEVRGAQRGPAAEGGGDGVNVREEVIFIHVSQRAFAEESGGGAHFALYGGVFLREVGVPGPGVDEAGRVSRALGLEAEALYCGLVRSEVYGRRAAEGAGELVHEPAGLAEVLVLRAPGADGELHRPGPAAEYAGEQHLEGGGAREARAHRDGARDGDVHASRLKAAAAQRVRYAAGEGRARKALLRARGCVAYVNLKRLLPLAYDAQGVKAVRRGGGEHIESHGGGEDAAALMVRVVADELRAARGAVEALGPSAERGPEVPGEARGARGVHIHSPGIRTLRSTPPSMPSTEPLEVYCHIS